VNLSPSDADYLASRLIGDAGLPTTKIVPTPIIARELLGPGAIQIVPPAVLRPLGALARVGTRWRIFLRRGLAPELIGHVVGHELAHWAAKRDGATFDEDDCDLVGAALVLPRGTVPAGLDHLDEAARAAHASQSLVALRVGEARGVPLVLVAPHRVRVRGPDDWCWPDEDTVRAWARSGQRVARVRLSDDRRRVVLVGREP
jgi:hypothetical protein